MDLWITRKLSTGPQFCLTRSAPGALRGTPRTRRRGRHVRAAAPGQQWLTYGRSIAPGSSSRGEGGHKAWRCGRHRRGSGRRQLREGPGAIGVPKCLSSGGSRCPARSAAATSRQRPAARPCTVIGAVQDAGWLLTCQTLSHGGCCPTADSRGRRSLFVGRGPDRLGPTGAAVPRVGCRRSGPPHGRHPGVDGRRRQLRGARQPAHPRPRSRGPC